MCAQESVSSIVDSFLVQAIKHHASDIHLEPQEDSLRLRYRIDGLLYDQKPISKEQAAQVLSRIKILSHLDIAEKRLPQDGKFSINYDDHIIDLRVSSFPGIYGEKIVIRLLDRVGLLMPLENLGMNAQIYQKLTELLMRSHGFILVTGPTGSGKTTTLYAGLSRINSTEKNMLTLEDPIEYIIPGITQAQINADIGFSFARGIRAMLRQDPDVVMIGEIRDQETAQTAVDASLTGHLVLSTLHTNDAPAALMRLLDMAIEPFLINASVSGILAQRLARKLCVNCKTERKPTDQEKKVLEKIELNMKQLFDSAGCTECFFLGHKGRIGIFEFLEMSNDLRSLLIQKPNFDDVYKLSVQNGMQRMMQDAKDKATNGVISLQELSRLFL